MTTMSTTNITRRQIAALKTNYMIRSQQTVPLVIQLKGLENRAFTSRAGAALADAIRAELERRAELALHGASH